jgi:hypothetical protein
LGDDSTSTYISDTAANQFVVRANGGVFFSNGVSGSNQKVSWTPGSGSWSFSSDRNLKEGITPVNAVAVLEKVASLPLNEWNYIGYPQRHIGPMALAAIQGLNRKLNEKDAEIQALKQSVAELKEILTHLTQQPK